VFGALNAGVERRNSFANLQVHLSELQQAEGEHGAPR
jgi:hypothetical protein